MSAQPSVQNKNNNHAQPANLDTLINALPNTFHWSARHTKILAAYKANPFKQALALKPDEINGLSDDAQAPILMSAITAQPLPEHHAWLATANEWLTLADDDFVDYAQRAKHWDARYDECQNAVSQYHRQHDDDNCLYSFEFNNHLAVVLFAKLSLSKKISFIGIQKHSDSLHCAEIAKHYQALLRYIQALIYHLKTDNPAAYQALYQCHSRLHPEAMAIFFEMPYPYPKFSKIDDRWLRGDNGRYIRPLYLSPANATVNRASVFSQAYHDAISCRGYKVGDILPALLYFLEMCQQAAAPHLIIDLLDEIAEQQKRNQHLFKVLEDFEHILYLDWLIKNSDYPETAKPLSHWAAAHPILTLSKLAVILTDRYGSMSGYPDFSAMSQKDIRQHFYYEKPVFDALKRDYNHIHQLFSNLATELYTSQPAEFAALQATIAAQNLSYHSHVIAPIFFKISQVALRASDIDMKNQLTDENAAQLSDWLITPPWLHKEYRLQAPKLPEHLAIALLPKPIFKSDGSELPLELLENLIGILDKSDVKGWIKPLKDADILQLLAPFTRESLNSLGRALWHNNILTPWGWLMNESAVDFMHDYIYDNKHVGSDTDGSRLLIRMMTASITLWYPLEQERVSAHISRTLEEMFYQMDKGKPRFRRLVYQMFDEIRAVTGYSQKELRDLAVPMLGFDEHGEQVFDLDTQGDNRLTLRLDAHLSPLLFDQNGAPLNSFPRAKKDDDKARFKQVNTELKTIKKQLERLYKQLNERLTTDLQQGHKRSLSFMLKVFLKHPILQKYAQTLFWSLNKPTGKRWEITDTFIMTADKALLDMYYNEYSAANIAEMRQIKNATVVLTHPATLSAENQQAALEWLDDHAIAQPIEQMSVSCLRPNHDELATHSISRFEGTSMFVDTLYQNLYPLHADIESLSCPIDKTQAQGFKVARGERGQAQAFSASRVYGTPHDTSEANNFVILFKQTQPFEIFSEQTGYKQLFYHLPLTLTVQLQPIDIHEKNPIMISQLLLAITGAVADYQKITNEVTAE